MTTSSSLDLRFKRDLKAFQGQTLGKSEKALEFLVYRHLVEFLDHHLLEPHHLSYGNPHYADGLITVDTLKTTRSFLIEAKLGRDFHQATVRNAVLSQALFYLHELWIHDELLPAVVLLLEQSSLVMVPTAPLFKIFTSTTCDWEAVAKGDATKGGLLVKELETEEYPFTLVDLFATPLQEWGKILLDHLDASPFFLHKTFAYETRGAMAQEAFSFEAVKARMEEKVEGVFVYRPRDNALFRIGYKDNLRTSSLEEFRSFVARRLKSAFPDKLDSSLSLMLDSILDDLLEAVSDDELVTPEEEAHNKRIEPLEEWFDEEVEVNPDALVTIGDLTNSYNQWAVSRHQAKMSVRGFSDLLRNHSVITTLGQRVIYKRANPFPVMLKRSAFVDGVTNEIHNPESTRGAFLTGLSLRRGVVLERPVKSTLRDRSAPQHGSEASS